MQKLCAFEKNLLDSLKRLVDLPSVKTLGAAVSGGADSVSLLAALCAAKEQSAAFPKLLCVTVDHSIRPEEESSGDAAFVAGLCQKLGVECVVKKIERGAVERLAGVRKKGLEEAARFLRYQKFEEFAKENEVQFICLAHNQNDALETLLMRFLQGSSSSYGIAARRGIYLRPLLDTGREEIENYLRQKKMDWRTDSTNQENAYFRNKVRNLLSPFLDKNFEGWKKALLSGAEKAAFENDALDECLCRALGAEEPCFDEYFERAKGPDGSLVFTAETFLSLPVALRQRLLYRAFDFFKLEKRVPYSFVRDLSFWPEKSFKKAAAAGLEAVEKKDKVFLKILKKEATESGFFDIIRGEDASGGVCVARTRAVGDKV